MAQRIVQTTADWQAGTLTNIDLSSLPTPKLAVMAAAMGPAQYPANGTIITAALDLVYTRQAAVQIALVSTTPTGTAATVTSWRDSANNQTWSAWQGMSGALTSAAPRRYLQLQITLTTTDTSKTPSVSSLTVTLQDLVLGIAGTEMTPYLVPGTLRVPDRVNARSECGFTLRLKLGGWFPDPLSSVQIYLNGGVLRFDGFVWDPEGERLVEDVTKPATQITVRCVDVHYLADKLHANESYQNVTAGYIVRDLIAKYLAAEGVTVGNIQDGPTLQQVVLPHIPVTQAMDELAEKAGFYWIIKAGRALDFADRSTNLAPWVLDASAKVRQVKIRKHREQYRNRQIFRGGQGITSQRTDQFVGDGKRKAFTLTYQVAQVPARIKVNGVAVNSSLIGIHGLDTGKSWYWNKGSKEIIQDDAQTILRGPSDPGGPDLLEVTYQGLYPIVVQADLPAEIAARQKVESYSGVHEAYAEDLNINGEDAATQFAQALLQRHHPIRLEIDFNTETPGLASGQLLTVNLPDIDPELTNALLMITEVEQAELETADGKPYRYFVKAVSGDAFGGWQTFFKDIAKAQRTFVIRENEVLIRLKSFTDGVNITDTLTWTKGPPTSLVGTAQVGFSEVAS